MELFIPKGKIKKLFNQINEINQAVHVLYNVKKEIITKIEDTKQQIRNFCTKKLSHGKIPSIVIKDRIVSLLDSCKKSTLKMSATDEVFALMREIKTEFDRSLSLLELKILDNVDFEIPEDISHIQNLHDIVVQDLEELKKTLDSHTAIVEKTELIMNILNYKLYEIQFQFRTEFDKMKAKKDSLTKMILSGKEQPTATLRIVEIDDNISKLEETHQKNLDCVKEQKLDAQKAYEQAVQVMDQNLEKMTSGLNKLLVLIEAQKASMNDSQAHFIDSKFSAQIEQFKTDIEKYTELQTTGWKVMYPEEKISELLHQRGLKILQSGQLITGDGQTITFKQAQESRLFDDINSDVLKELKDTIMGDDATTQSTNSTTSIGTIMSSEDVTYLKNCLGKPLTLALAEITSLQPKDPIHYLGHWLFKYRYNQQMTDVNNIEFEILNEKRTEIAKERWHKFIEKEAKAAVIDMIIRAEEIAILNELKRIEKEAEAMEEREGLDDEARDTLGPYGGPSTGQMPL